MHQGSCLCCSIKYCVEHELTPIVHCHCEYCRRAHGAAFVTFLSIPQSSFEIVQGQDFLARYSYRFAGSDAYRCFCSNCGTRLFNHLPSLSRVSVIAATLIDISEGEIHPLAHINTESTCPWISIADDLPQYFAVPGPGEIGKLVSK